MGSVAKVITITARSQESFDDAVKVGIAKAAQTLKHLKGAWVKDQKVEIEDDKVVAYQVTMEVTFLLED